MTIEDVTPENKGQEEQKTGRIPDFRGDGIAIWMEKTKDGRPYASVKLFGKISIPAWENKPKE